VNLFTPESGAVYLFASGTEERSQHADRWPADYNINMIPVTRQDADDFAVLIDGTTYSISLRNPRQIQALINRFKDNPFYIDITGLSHHVWAPVLSAVVSTSRSVRVVYVEPVKYITSQERYDLSERVLGLHPLPGFAALSITDDANICLVPLLGFEEDRFLYTRTKIDPPANKTFPIIGVPGFLPDYPFVTYHENSGALKMDRSWTRARHADASCPFRLFYELEDLAARHPRDVLRIAMLGTKPHALGAVIFAIARRNAELVYDHPVRKPGRTDGSGWIYVYHVSSFAPLVDAIRSRRRNDL